MRIDDLLSVTLEVDNVPLEEIRYSDGQNPTNGDAKLFRAAVNVQQPDTNYRPVVRLHGGFNLFTGRGIKIAVASGHPRPEHESHSLHDVQVRFAPLERSSTKTIVIPAAVCFRAGEDVKEKIPFTVPDPKGEDMKKRRCADSS